MRVRTIVAACLVALGLLASGWPPALARVALVQTSAQGPKCDELQVVFVIDESGSMSRTDLSAPPSDPDGLRWQGPQEGVAFLGSLRYQVHPDAKMRVAIVHFGDRPSLGLLWADIMPDNEADYQQLLSQLQPYFEPYKDLGNTNPLAAFQNVSSLFDMLPPQVGACPRRAVIVLTDGQPAIPSKTGFSWQNHLRELAKYVQSYMPAPGHQVYVLGLDRQNSFWHNNESYWDEVTGDPSRAIRAASDSELAQKLWEILSAEADHLVATGQAIEECVKGGEVVVRPFVQQVRMTYFKPDVNSHLTVVDEGGRAIEPGRADMSVTLNGLAERIETLVVKLPQPGVWQITQPSSAQDTALICITSFVAQGQVVTPPDGALLTQFKDEPLQVRIADSAGNPLPDYHDQRYLPKVEVLLTAPSMMTETVNTTPGALNEFDGVLHFAQSGPHTVTVRATSQDPKGGEFEIFNKPMATYVVAPVAFKLVTPPPDEVGQGAEVKVNFELQDEKGNPVTPGVAPSLAITLTSPTTSTLLAPTQAADGSWELAFKVAEPGRQTLTYETVAHTAAGPLPVSHDETSFSVYATTPVVAVIVKPTGPYVATDMFFRPTGLPLQVQLTDAQGHELSPGQVGAANPMALFAVTVTDEQGKDRSAELQMGNTGKPGLFEARGVTLGPGVYNITVKPGSTLAREYLWAAPEWTASARGTINPLVAAPIGAAVLLAALIALIVLRSIAVRRHPLFGYIEIYEMRTDAPLGDEGVGRDYRVPAFRATLPRRNRVTYRASAWRSSRDRLPVGWIKVLCPSEEDAKAQRAHVIVGVKGSAPMETVLGPESPAFSLGSGFLLEKGPRALSFDGGLGEETEIITLGRRE